ncbi:hypothetical protein COCNU_scaffold040709G000020 [Cocos nucifera]|nr:hypothetical protein [Cocos nucifera]
MGSHEEKPRSLLEDGLSSEGMGILTLSASVPAFLPSSCEAFVCPEARPTQYAILFIGLYLIALGTGGIKPCVSSFGADQFDDTDPAERVKKGSFFNRFYFSVNIGALVSSSFLVWVQDNYGWALGFGTPTLFMVLAIVSFFSGASLYRFQKPGGSPITRVCEVVVASLRKWKVDVPHYSSLLDELPGKASAIKGSRKLEHTDELKFLDKAAAVSDLDETTESFSNPWRLCTVTQVEELKLLGWFLRRPLSSFSIPLASLSTFDAISVLLWIPVYDRVCVPLARRFTGNERGFSELQRMGISLFISILAMAAAALLQIKRLSIAKAEHLEHEKVAVPLSIFWQIPQYVLAGAAEVFTAIGQLEFFYDQSPDAMRSLCSALSFVTIAPGNYLSSLILTIVTHITTQGGKTGWIPNNLNEGHLDFFFWLLAALSLLNLRVYAYCSMRICLPTSKTSTICFFFFPLGLYPISLGTGGIKPCVSSFGADQFDDTDPAEKVKKGSFFNWCNFCINIGALIASTSLVRLQENYGWALAFGIPTLLMGLAIISFFSGTSFYRFQKPGGSPVARVCQVVVASLRKWKVDVPHDTSLLYEPPDKASAIKGSRKLDHTGGLKFLDKAATLSDLDKERESLSNPWRICMVTQMSTLFIEQGMVLDMTIGARKFTGNERGFSVLQRIGIAHFISMLAMAAAALLEIKRLSIVKAVHLEHQKVAVPLSIFWQIPQYVLTGAAEVFTIIGHLEFFYDQSPDAMRNLCSAFFLLITALGDYLSSLILTTCNVDYKLRREERVDS